ncbi:hypothetical protein AVEN_195658-1 [Araneus ventricosus]|uniref:Uncharacterized protein n=1 Tax=Araneus ventricosus TaxID=182803 RepID=A0A4Y2B9E4_ARAVE|nr:hypothetical protein AVEN_195658-1 [Araneus ventricosus]
MTRAKSELTPLSKLPHNTGRRMFVSTYNSACNRNTYMAGLPWNRVSNLEPTSPHAKTLPLGHRSMIQRVSRFWWMLNPSNLDVFPLIWLERRPRHLNIVPS